MTWTDTAFASIIVAGITVAGSVAVAIISRKDEKTKNEDPIPERRLEERIPIEPVVVTARSKNTSPQDRNIAEKISNITHRAIKDHIRRVPPFQRDSIEAHYIGLRVRWRVFLLAVDERADGEANVHGNIAETKTAIDCEGKKEDFNSLIHVAEGEEIEVEGTIHMVSGAYTILRHCVAYQVNTQAGPPAKSSSCNL